MRSCRISTHTSSIAVFVHTDRTGRICSYAPMDRISRSTEYWSYSKAPWSDWRSQFFSANHWRSALSVWMTPCRLWASFACKMIHQSLQWRKLSMQQPLGIWSTRQQHARPIEWWAVANTQHHIREHGRRQTQLLFIEGRPGRSKMFLVKTLSSILCAQEQIVLIVGSSTLAATAYECGCTAHHMFGIPVTDESVELHSSIHPHSPCLDLIWNASAIVWNKLPAINRAAWESIDELCCIICNRPKIPFGGKSSIGLGDFQQAGQERLWHSQHQWNHQCYGHTFGS